MQELLWTMMQAVWNGTPPIHPLTHPHTSTHPHRHMLMYTHTFSIGCKLASKAPYSLSLRSYSNRRMCVVGVWVAPTRDPIAEEAILQVFSEVQYLFAHRAEISEPLLNRAASLVAHAVASPGS